MPFDRTEMSVKILNDRFLRSTSTIFFPASTVKAAESTCRRCSGHVPQLFSFALRGESALRDIGAVRPGRSGAEDVVPIMGDVREEERAPRQTLATRIAALKRCAVEEFARTGLPRSEGRRRESRPGAASIPRPLAFSASACGSMRGHFSRSRP